MTVPFLDHDGPIAFAHRGFSREGLESSMSAFQAAVDLGYRYLETDVHATADGRLVAFHDVRLARLTGDRGRIEDLPWEVVRRARILGREPLPLLEDVLGTWPDVRVNIDVKRPGAIRPLARVLTRTNAFDRVCVASFADRRRRAVLRLLPRPVATSAGGGTVLRFLAAVSARRPDVAVRAVLADVDCLQLPHRVVTAAVTAAAHRAGVQVHAWTVDEEADMTRLLDVGVDGLMTDRADTLRAVLRARGVWAG